jgi:AcrR family transcriptional regulator
MSSTMTLGRRESSKADKRRRIISAARNVFATVGFEQATTYEIARRARIATGTLFLYARDKHELLLMVFNDDLDRITEESLGAARPGTSFADELSEFCRRRFEFWAADIELGRIVTADVYASRGPGDYGAEMARAQARQQRILAALTEKVAAFAQREKVQLRDTPEVVARAIHYLYIGELRMWLGSERPKVAEGLRNLRRLHALLIAGIVTTS